MTRCTAHMATFCTCRFKRGTITYRMRAKVKTWLLRITPPCIDLGDWP